MPQCATPWKKNKNLEEIAISTPKFRALSLDDVPFFAPRPRTHQDPKTQSNPKMFLLFIKSFILLPLTPRRTMGTFFKVFFIVALTDRNDLLVEWVESFANFCVSVNYC